MAVCPRNVLNTFQRRVNKNSLIWWYFLKTSWRYIWKTFWRYFEDLLLRPPSKCLEDVLNMSWRRLGKTPWRCLQEELMTSWKHLEYVLKISWRHVLQDVLKATWKRPEDVLKKYDQDEYTSLEHDVLKTSWRPLLKSFDEGEYIRLD